MRRPSERRPDLELVTAGVATLPQLALLLSRLRRREARQRGASELTCRELAAKTGWSHGIIARYFTGEALPPTDRFDVLIRVLGATAEEQGALATAYDRVEDGRREAGLRRRVPAIPVVVPRQLPPAGRHFVGRDGELAILDGLLRLPAGTGTVSIAAIDGTAGVGKSALAVYWAHRVADRFPDGQLYLNLRGFEPTGIPVDPDEAVRGVLDALGVAVAQIPTGPDARAGLYRSLLAGRRVLLVLDNARDAAQVRPLLPSTAEGLVVVTSRTRLSGLVSAQGALPVTLDMLPTQDARALLARHLGTARVAADAPAVADIIAGCAGLPLALSVVAARAASHPWFALADVAAELRDTRRGLDALDGGEAGTDVRAVFSWSYRMCDPPAARLFRLLGLHPGPDIGVAAAASLAGAAPPEVAGALAQLARAHLIRESAPGRYTLHDLLRGYAAEQASTVDSAAQREAALVRLLEHYTHSAYAADRLLSPHRDPLDLDGPGIGVSPESPVDAAAAMEWFAAWRPVLLGAVRLAGADPTGPLQVHVPRLARSLTTFLDRRGHWLDIMDTQSAALSAARRTGDRRAQASAHLGLANAYNWLGRHADARAEYERGIQVCAALGDGIGRAHIHRSLAVLCERMGEPADALRNSRQALALYQAGGHGVGCARAMGAIGWAYALLGRYSESVEQSARALALHQDNGDRQGEAAAWDNLGLAYLRLGRWGEAERCLRAALALWRALGDRYYEAWALVRLGDTHDAAGRTGEARPAWRDAAAILDDLAHPDAEEIRANLDQDA